MGNLGLSIVMGIIMFHRRVGGPGESVVNPPGYEMWHNDGGPKMSKDLLTRAHPWLLSLLTFGGMLLTLLGPVLTVLAIGWAKSRMWATVTETAGALTSLLGAAALTSTFIILLRDTAMEGKLFLEHVRFLRMPLHILSNIYTNWEEALKTQDILLAAVEEIRNDKVMLPDFIRLATPNAKKVGDLLDMAKKASNFF
jgi:hypothetical protein